MLITRMRLRKRDVAWMKLPSWRILLYKQISLVYRCKRAPSPDIHDSIHSLRLVYALFADPGKSVYLDEIRGWNVQEWTLTKSRAKTKYADSNPVNCFLEQYVTIQPRLETTPELCIEKLRAYVDVGVTHLFLNFPDMLSLEPLRLFGEHVLPAFKWILSSLFVHGYHKLNKSHYVLYTRKSAMVNLVWAKT